ncbi:hypothetical protein KET34_10520 [Paenibacillus pabuli]|nr:hypothetical protein KET34_10520 [Paenibacillus pabuli]
MSSNAQGTDFTNHEWQNQIKSHRQCPNNMKQIHNHCQNVHPPQKFQSVCYTSHLIILGNLSKEKKTSGNSGGFLSVSVKKFSNLQVHD